MIEQRHRGLIKSISWRATGALDTILVSWLVSRKLHLAPLIGFVELFGKLGVCYAHERIWNEVGFGRRRLGPEHEI